jgi:hypothetical protein
MQQVGWQKTPNRMVASIPQISSALIQRCDIIQNYRNLHEVVQHLSQHNLKISHYFHKSSVKEIMIQRTLVGMSMNFYHTILHLSKCNSPWVVSIKKNVNFNLQPHAMFVFLVFSQVVLLKVIHPLKIYQHTKCHSRRLTGASFTSTSEV